MKRHHKITLGSLGATVAIIAGVFTIIEKTPSVINVIASMMKAEASEIPENKSIDTTRVLAGNAIVQFENVQQPKGAK